MKQEAKKPSNTFLNGWEKSKDGVAKLTDQERRLLERWDRPIKSRPAYSLRGRRTKDAEVEQEERFFIPGEPILVVAQIKHPTVKSIRKQFETGSTLFALSLRYNLREEWIQEVIDNPKEMYFAW